MLAEIQFNLAISISLLITVILILILTIFEFIAYIICNKFLIFKKNKIASLGWIINVIVLLIVSSITALLFVLNSSQNKYLPYAIAWLIVTCVSLSLLISRTILILKSKKNKYEIKNALSLNLNDLANKFKIKDFNNPLYKSKHLENNAWYKNLKQSFNFLINNIDGINADNVASIASEIITFEEIYCATAFNKRNKYAFCLFLILLNNLQKKLKNHK